MVDLSACSQESARCPGTSQCPQWKVRGASAGYRDNVHHFDPQTSPRKMADGRRRLQPLDGGRRWWSDGLRQSFAGLRITTSDVADNSAAKFARMHNWDPDVEARRRSVPYAGARRASGRVAIHRLSARFCRPELAFFLSSVTYESEIDIYATCIYAPWLASRTLARTERHQVLRDREEWGSLGGSLLGQLTTSSNLVKWNYAVSIAVNNIVCWRASNTACTCRQRIKIHYFRITSSIFALTEAKLS